GGAWMIACRLMSELASAVPVAASGASRIAASMAASMGAWGTIAAVLASGMPASMLPPLLPVAAALHVSGVAGSRKLHGTISGSEAAPHSVRGVEYFASGGLVSAGLPA